MSRFSNSEGRGFHLTFDNKWTISVQFCGGHYCDNYTKNWNFAQEKVAKGDSIQSSTAEIAVLSNNGMISLENDTVRGYTTADEVARVITIVSRAKSTINNKQMSNKLKKVWQ